MRKYVEVSGSGAAAAPPDRLDLHLTATALRPGVAEALARVSAGVAALGTALRDHGLTDADLRTTSSSVYEEYAGPDNSSAGFRANHEITVRVADLERLGEVFDACVAALGDELRLNHLSWGISDETQLASQARAAAFEDARAKAAELAALAGRGIGELLQVGESVDGLAPVPRFALAKADAGFAPERGISQVEVTLTTRWALV